MVVTASKLRESIYRLLDAVLRTGEALEIERNGKRLRIIPVEPIKKLSRLEQHDVCAEDPENFVHIDWSKEWKPRLK
jgi:hypothetical protein